MHLLHFVPFFHQDFLFTLTSHWCHTTNQPARFVGIYHLKPTLWHCITVCASVPQNTNTRLMQIFFFIVIIFYLTRDLFSSCGGTVVSRICWSRATQYNKHLRASERHDRILEKLNIFFHGKWSLHDPSFLRNVPTPLPSRAAKHSS